MNKRKIVSAILCVLCSIAYQVTAQDFASVLSEKLAAFYKVNIPVKLHLFFNQPEYALGDTAWFSASFLTAHNYHGIGGRMIINMDLADDNGKITAQQKIEVVNGFGHSYLAFPATLRPGMYTVVAYNDWMKNYDSSLFFYKKIALAQNVAKATKATRPFTLFPEGGNLVADVQNKIVVRGAAGSEITIRDQTGKQKANCRIDSAGFGVLFLTPSAEDEYTANDNAGRKVKLSKPQTDKVALMVTVPERTKPLRVIMQIAEGTELLRDNFNVVLSNHDVIQYSASVRFDAKGVSVISIPQQDLLPGISRLTVFRNEQHVAAERLIFVSPSSEPQVEILFDKDVYQPREKVTVALRPRKGSANAVDSKLSCTVTATDVFTQPDRTNLLKETLYLRGDLPVDPTFDITTSDTNLDNYLITETWRRFSWDEVLVNPRKNTIPFARELFLAGKVKRINSNKPFADSTLIAFFLPQNNQTYFEYLQPDGGFDLPLSFDFYKSESVFYKVVYRNREVDDVVVELSPRADYSSLAVNRSGSDGSLTHYGEFHKKKSEIGRAYNMTPNFKSSVNGNKLIEELFVPDFSVRLSDYLLFPTMEETLKEVVPALERRVRQGKSVVRLVRSDLARMPDHDPIYFIDGVLTDNSDYFLSLNPKDVSTIKIINTVAKLQKLGPVGMHGVVLVETLIHNNAVNVPAPQSGFNAIGLNESGMIAPVSKVPAFRRRVPYLASNIYWNPELQTSKGTVTFSFYAPDNAGVFTLQASGITSDGEPVSGEKSFMVRFSAPE